MRELLFRGFHPCDGPETIVVDGEKAKGRWVEGYYVERDNKSWIYPASNQMISKSLARELRPFHSAKSTQKIMKEVFPVLPSTVGQHIGLTDKNGKRIFEGDIVSYHHPFKNRTGSYAVEFSGYAFGCKGFYNTCYDAPWDAFSEGTKYFEVIGTVFDEEARNDHQ